MNTDLELPADAPQTGTYRHYKGNLYQVLGISRHSETEEWMVVYQALYAERGFWVRPLSIWLEPVAPKPTPSSSDEETDQKSHAQSVIQRFELVTPTDLSLTQLTKNLTI